MSKFLTKALVLPKFNNLRYYRKQILENLKDHADLPNPIKTAVNDIPEDTMCAAGACGVIYNINSDLPTQPHGIPIIEGIAGYYDVRPQDFLNFDAIQQPESEAAQLSHNDEPKESWLIGDCSA